MAEKIEEGDMVRGTVLNDNYGTVRTSMGAYAVVMSCGRKITCKLADLTVAAKANKGGTSE